MHKSSNTPVVLLHGSAGKPSQWMSVTAHLAPSYDIRMPSLPGYGSRAAIENGGRVADEAYTIVRESVRAGERVHLVGHSYGGAVALKIAMAWPERVKSLTVIEPAVFHLLRDGGLLERHMYADIADVDVKLRKAAASGEPETGVANFVDFWCGEGSWLGIAPEKRHALVAQADRIIGNFTSVARENWTLSECMAVKAPVMMLTGTSSPVLVQHLTRLIAGAMSDARVIAVSDASHMLPFTHGPLVAKLLSHHFAQADATSVPFRTAA